MARRPRTPKEWTDAVWSEQYLMDEVPLEKQQAVQTLGMRRAEKVFQVEARRKRGEEMAKRILEERNGRSN